MFHGWRVHLQVIEWSGVTGFNPEKWGWALKENKLLPLSGRTRCSCRQHDLYVVVMRDNKS